MMKPPKKAENKMMPPSHTAAPTKGEAGKIKAEAAKKMTAAEWEKSATDARQDRANAKKAGMTMKQWEDSPGDKKADAKGLKAHNAKVAAKGKK